MLEDLARQFLGSDVASEAIAAVMNDTDLDEAQAQRAVQATAEGAAQAAADQGGLAALAGELLGSGSGGLAGLAGSLLGGGASSASSPLVDTVAGFVAQETGLDPALARTVVGLALPKVIAYFQGSGGGAPSGSPLGGLFGS